MYGKYLFCRNIVFKTVHTNIYKINSRCFIMYYYSAVYTIVHIVMFYYIIKFVFQFVEWPSLPTFHLKKYTCADIYTNINLLKKTFFHRMAFPAYVSPEEIHMYRSSRNKSICFNGKKRDVWRLGIMLYTMLVFVVK